MNPSNPFGSTQRGAFQAPNPAGKVGPFQPFGQSSAAQAQSSGGFFGSGFGQPSNTSMFGQTSGFGHQAVGQAAPTPQSGPIFGQASSTPLQPPAFGQTTTTPQNASIFGQTLTTATTTQHAAAPAFGQQSAPAFGPTAAQSNASSMFGQNSSFGRAFVASGSDEGFSSHTSAFGAQKQPPQFGHAPAAGSGLGFAQPVFGQPTSTASTTSVFGTSSTNTSQSRSFQTSDFSFKPSNKALFKPIISASPEPSTTSAVSGFRAAPGPSTTGLFQSKPDLSGFSFSQPAPLPGTQHTAVTSQSGAGGLQFTFSQPATPASGSRADAGQPTTPSTFSFTTKTLFVGSKFSDTSQEKDESGATPTVETNVFARLGKRKEESPGSSPLTAEKEALEDLGGDSDAPRQPPKRPLVRSRGPPSGPHSGPPPGPPSGPPPGLFGRALSGLRRDVTAPGKRQSVGSEKEAPQQRAATPPATTEEPSEQPAPPPAPLLSCSASFQSPPAPLFSSPAPLLSSPASPAPLLSSRLGQRSSSTDSLPGSTLQECTVLQCRDLPPALNQREVLEKHFRQFGRVRRVLCRPQRNSAMVYFHDHASAAKAKRKGRTLNKFEMQLFWWKKKHAADKGLGVDSALQQEVLDLAQTVVSIPIKRPALRPSALGGSFGSPVKKSPMARSLQFEDPQRESGPDPPSQDRSQSLLPLIGQTAESAEDKYRLLEQRDKILRHVRPKRTEQYFVGTCPDMCPEKERYMRETRKQLSFYEVLPATETVNHAAAIKEYSRSSADQEEPLPHELRPLRILVQTMDYIVTRILDQGSDNYRDWYDFVWNRTRGIRKDIIQQHLCCPRTVSLIEKCARFHVHCAHELCEEPMVSFDSKINNENLTKCLQSLKEMYQDLSMRGQHCAREAEFRHYNVLLKLNDGDILREVQQFREEVRNSAEVKFSVQCFSAVNSNNFVRFFKLVQSASYLSSCLLHRYFTQVRSQALKALNMAHTVGPRSTVFPVDDIVRMLMFRNSEEASTFVQQFGLNVSDGLVELSRPSFQEPEIPVSSHRSELILSKRRVLVGEVVHGGSLPSAPLPLPVCSFDSLNRYRDEPQATSLCPASDTAPPTPETPEAPPESQDRPSVFGPVVVQSVPAAPEKEPEESEETAAFVPSPDTLFQPISQPSPYAPMRASTPPPVYSQEEVEAEVGGLLEEVLVSAVREISEAAVCYTSAALIVSVEQVDSLVAEVAVNLLKEISATEMELERDRIREERRCMEEARRRREHEAFLVDYSFSLCSELIHQVLDETIEKTAATEIQSALDERAALEARCSEDVCRCFLEEALTSHIWALVQQLLDQELQRIHKYIKRWRDVVFLRRQLKRQMRAFPAAPCFVDPTFRLRALASSTEAHTPRELSLSSSRLVRVRDYVMHQMRVQYFYQLLLDEASWAPLDLPALVIKHFPNPPPQILWKTLLLLPSHHETSVADRVLCDWLQVKLGASSEDHPAADGKIDTLSICSSVQQRDKHTHTVHVAVKVSSRPLSENCLCQVEQSGDLQGTRALLLLLPASALLQGPEDLCLLSALLQLRQVQQSSSWDCAIPLVLLVPGRDRGPGHTQALAQALMLSQLVEDGLLSEYTFFFLPETTSDLQGSRQLSISLRWLVSRSPPPPTLSPHTLVQLVESCLHGHFSARLLVQRQERASAGLPPQRPQAVIHLYNSLLGHVAAAVSAPGLSQLSWPPLEFCVPDTRGSVPPSGWNQTQHLVWLREAVLSLQLPEWDTSAPTESWSDLCSSVQSYADLVSPCLRSRPLLTSRLQNLLQRLHYCSQGRRTPGAKVSCWWTEQEMCENVPWDDVLVVCIDHKLKNWTLTGDSVCRDAVLEDGEILVFCHPLSSFSSDEWNKVTMETHREKKERQRSPPQSLSLKEAQCWSLKPQSDSSAPDVCASAEEALAHRVLVQLKEERRSSNRAMEQFQRWADGGAPELLYSPRLLPSLKPLPQVLGSAVGSDHGLDHGAVLLRSPGPSLSWRMKDLERQIRTSHEEELVLRGLLHMVQD